MHQQIGPLFLMLMMMRGYAIIAHILTAPSPLPFRHMCEQHLQHTLHTHRYTSALAYFPRAKHSSFTVDPLAAGMESGK